METLTDVIIINAITTTTTIWRHAARKGVIRNVFKILDGKFQRKKNEDERDQRMNLKRKRNVRVRLDKSG
jgi:hypothetical protein